MAVKIRLARHGSKKNPIYRVVVADSRVPRDGRTIEEIGRYNPQTQPSLVEIDADRAREWLSRGAQPTATVRKLLTIAGRVDGGRTSWRTSRGSSSTIPTRSGSSAAMPGPTWCSSCSWRGTTSAR